MEREAVQVQYMKREGIRQYNMRGSHSKTSYKRNAISLDAFKYLLLGLALKISNKRHWSRGVCGRTMPQITVLSLPSPSLAPHPTLCTESNGARVGKCSISCITPCSPSSYSLTSHSSLFIADPSPISASVPPGSCRSFLLQPPSSPTGVEKPTSHRPSSFAYDPSHFALAYRAFTSRLFLRPRPVTTFITTNGIVLPSLWTARPSLLVK